MKSMFLLAMAVTALSLTGCWESSDITVHEAGEYKGVVDPLLSQNSASRIEVLNKRFQLIQMAR